MEILTTVFYIIICVLLFALAILIHEFGHFIVALKLGLRVDRFSIGFGPALWKKTYKGVEYRISAIPLGGYVSIPDVDPEGTKKLEGGSSGSITRQNVPPWKEILVSVAGPGMNIVLAIVLAVILSLIPSARFGELPAIIGEVLPDGAAEKGGILPGDKVVAINGNPVGNWTEMQVEIQISGTNATAVTVERGEPAAKTELTVYPKRDELTGACYIMAVSTTNYARSASWMIARNPVKQLAWDAKQIFRVLKGLVTPKEMKTTANALGGPQLIAEGIYKSIRRDFWDGVGFLRFLNVNLAILNLLPLPVLDGGLILFALIALIIRRRLPEKFTATLSMAFLVLLMAAMGVLILKDAMRSWRINHYKPPVVTTNETFTADSPR